MDYPTSETVPCRGDLYNDELRFATFFPGVLQPHVDAVANAVGKLLKIPSRTAAAAESLNAGTSTLPGSDDAEAARRRYESISERGLIMKVHRTRRGPPFKIDRLCLSIREPSCIEPTTRVWYNAVHCAVLCLELGC